MSPTIMWLIAGAVFIAIEIFGMPGLGFLFAGIGALLIGGAIEFGVIGAGDYLVQFALFFVFACISAAMLWKHLKPRVKTSYSDIVGSEAVVAPPGLVGNREGQIKWSGTLMRARIVPNDGYDAIAEESAVIIHSVEGNLAYVRLK